MKVFYNAGEDLVKPIRNNREKVLTEEMQEIVKFLETDNNNVVFEYDDEDTARKKRNNVATHARKQGLSVKALLRGNKVIVIRKE